MEVLEEMKKKGCKKIFLQFAEGLTIRIEKIVKELEMNGFSVVLCMEPTFGPCDLREDEAKKLGCDCILHIGHLNYFKLKTKIPVYFWEFEIEVKDFESYFKKFAGKIDCKKIGIVASLQFLKLIGKAKKILEEMGKKVFIGSFCDKKGLITGCNFKAAKEIEDLVDCFLVISAGNFHALGLALETDKKVLLFDVEKRKLIDIEVIKKKFEKLRAWNLCSFKEAKKIGLIICWKKGQLFKEYEKLASYLRKMGKDVIILATDEIKPEKLEGLRVDFLINTACPRIGIDDVKRFKVPIVNLKDLHKEGYLPTSF